MTVRTRPLQNSSGEIVQSPDPGPRIQVRDRFRSAHPGYNSDSLVKQPGGHTRQPHADD